MKTNVILTGVQVGKNDLYVRGESVRDRLKRGWNYEKALTEPVETKFRRKVGGMEDGCV